MPSNTVNLMEDQREYKGYWWHPDDPEGRVAGTLLFSREDGLHLDLIGVLKRVRPDQDPPEMISLHGQLIEGRAITLSNVSWHSICFAGPAFAPRGFMSATLFLTHT
jgi:hypothetical protein